MKQTIRLGDLFLRVISDRPLPVSSSLQMFLQEGEPQILVRYREGLRPPLPGGEPVGRDVLASEYRENDVRWRVASDFHGPVLVIRYRLGDPLVEVAANRQDYPGMHMTLEHLLQLLPMRPLLLDHSALVVHSACVVYRGRGVLFVGPSGMGKTTQRRLWEQTAGALPISNDRTVLYPGDGGWQASSYPIDGRDPVDRVGSCPLGAVVLLQQGPENRVLPLRPGQALRGLMNQTMVDCWDREAVSRAALLLTDLLAQVPVVEQLCTPDAAAVRCLKTYLEKGGNEHG